MRPSSENFHKPDYGEKLPTNTQNDKQRTGKRVFHGKFSSWVKNKGIACKRSFGHGKSRAVASFEPYDIKKKVNFR